MHIVYNVHSSSVHLDALIVHVLMRYILYMELVRLSSREPDRYSVASDLSVNSIRYCIVLTYGHHSDHEW